MLHSDHVDGNLDIAPVEIRGAIKLINRRGTSLVHFVDVEARILLFDGTLGRIEDATVGGGGFRGLDATWREH